MDLLDRYHTVPKSSPIAILGVPFDNITVSDTVRLIEEMVESGSPHYLVTANIDFLVQGLQDVELRRIMFEAHLVLCDGTPLLWASRLLGNPLPERVAGSDLVPLLIQLSARKGYRIFFLGGSPDSCKQAVERLEKEHPDLQIAGWYSPPFSPLLDFDHEEINRRIQEAKPDLLFVSFGCPKQEKWIAMNYRSLGVPVSVGVGATIDFLAGRMARAPYWMRKTGTEWLFRLAQEPRRLFGRYVKDIWYFSWRFAAQWWRLSQFAKAAKQSQTPSVCELDDAWQRIEIPERLDADATRAHSLTWQNALANHRHCLLDLSKVRFIDSTGVGALIHLQKRARLSGREVVLLAPTEKVRRVLSNMHLEGFFDMAADEESAKQLYSNPEDDQPVLLKENGAAKQHVLVWQGEVTAVNAEQVWTMTESYIRCQAVWQKKLGIDLSKLHFIDSSGLGIMVRAKKRAVLEGVELMFTGIQPNVQNVVRLARLEDFLALSSS